MDRVAFTRNTLRDFVSHLTFRVTDDNIIVCHEECVADLTLCAEGFTGTGSAQNQTVRTFVKRNFLREGKIDHSVLWERPGARGA